MHHSKNDNLPRLDDLDSDTNPRNRIQAVHNIINKDDVKNEFGANHIVDENEDRAKENFYDFENKDNNDDSFENKNDNILLNEDVKGNKAVKGIGNRGKDSNQAIETYRESDELRNDEGLDDNNEDDEDDGTLNLPPKDGSLNVSHCSLTPHLHTHFKLE